MRLQFKKELYSKISVLKAAYNFTKYAYIHLDSDESCYFVELEMKQGVDINIENEFQNEMLLQTIRHEVYLQTKNIRELMFARSMATSLITEVSNDKEFTEEDTFSESDIMKDWFDVYDDSEAL